MNTRLSAPPGKISHGSNTSKLREPDGNESGHVSCSVVPVATMGSSIRPPGSSLKTGGIVQRRRNVHGNLNTIDVVRPNNFGPSPSEQARRASHFGLKSPMSLYKIMPNYCHTSASSGRFRGQVLGAHYPPSRFDAPDCQKLKSRAVQARLNLRQGA